MFRGKDGELSVVGRLAAGAFAGMTSTFVSKFVRKPLLVPFEVAGIVF